GVKTMSTVQPLKQMWNTWCDNDLSLEILHEHQQFLNIDTLPDRLKKQGVLSDDILSKMNGWQNFMFVPYKHDDDGNVVEALFLTRIIDELKKAELRQQEALRIANRAAEHDELTGLYNRYGFNKKIDQLYLKPEKKTVAVIMMDLDYFKQVNDVYGHDAGDLVLKNVACKLVSVFGDTSLYCRWGGEEFNTFVYDESIDPVQIAEELRKVVERSIIMHENKEIKITLSIGVCITHDMSATKISKLINTADKCMYISKRNGKNRVTVEQV
ncbi:MAG: GGDEF domain-containing protein, partial [Spirochaetaceae bacterium]|nr:GGDEF domain-containing protein [Spirochaetaceae bacterium]